MNEKWVEFGKVGKQNIKGEWKDYSRYAKRYHNDLVTRQKKKPHWQRIAFLLLVLVLFGVSGFLFFYIEDITGKAILLEKEVFGVNEIITGKVDFPIREGELIPADSIVQINVVGKVNSQSKQLILSAVLADEKEGELYFNGKSFGYGKGFGFEGEKVVYPTVNFKLRLIPVAGMPAAIMEIDGNCSAESPFVYGFDGNAELISGSVYSEGQQLSDNAITIMKGKDQIIIITEYSKTKKGFGKDFIGEEKKLGIDISKFDLRLPEDDYELEVKIFYDEEILFSSKSSFSVSSLFLPRITADTTPPSISFVPPTPANATSTTNTSVEINISITNADDFAEFIWNWNETNYTFYDDSLKLMMNLDNVSAIGDNETYAVDVSPASNNGTISGAVWNASGKYGSALSFDGSGDYVDAGNDSSLDLGNEFTFSAWVKIGGGEGTTRGILAKCHGESGNYKGYNLGLASDNKFYLTIDGGGWNYEYTISDNAYIDDNWHFIAGVRRDEVNYLYVDGVQQTDTGIQILANTAEPLEIGVWYSGTTRGYFFNGTIDEVAIYDRSLSADEIKQNYVSNLYKYDTDKWAFYTNQSNLTIGDYTYQGFAEDTSANSNSTDLRSLEILSAAEAPSISFVPPTPANATSTTNTSVEINISITNADDFAEFIWNWNETNYTFYDDSLKLMMNLDNVSAIGDNETCAVDVSPASNNGTISGAVWNASGKYGSALSFDGSGDYVNCGNDTSLNITDAITIEVWAKSTQNGVYQGIVGKMTANPYHGWVIGKFNSDKFFLLVADSTGAGYDYLYSDSAYTDTNWHHIVVVRSNGTNFFYVDGVLQTGSNTRALADSGQYAFIGRWYSNYDGYYFNGTIDEFAIYNRSLSADEIKQHYVSNLYKHDTDKWQFYSNQSNLSVGTYTYQGFAEDTSANSNSTDLRSLEILSAEAPPSISFVSPTPANATSTTNTSVEINISMTNADDLAEFIWNWNETNYTFYDDSLKLMMNLDNVSAIGDNETYAVDVSPASNNGTISGAVWNASGKYGSALSFDGSGDYVEKSNPSFASDQAGTFAAWIKPSDSNGPVFTFSKPSTTYVDEVRFYAYSTPANSLHYDAYLNKNYALDVYTPENSVSLNEWNFVAVTSDGSQIRIYIDGVEQEITVGGGSNNGQWFGDAIIDADTFTIGNLLRNGGPVWTFNGLIDEVAIYNRALSEDEITQHYVSNFYKYDTDKWLFYSNQSNLSVGSYTYFGYAKDDSGNSNMTEVRSLEISEEAVNVAPNITTPTITPDPAYTNSTLNCSTTYTDANEDVGNVTFTWYVNDSVVHNENVTSVSNGSVASSLLTEGNFSEDDNVICSARAYDGENYSEWKNSSTLTISNLAPDDPSPDLVSVDGTNYSTADLNCSATVTDKDDDKLNVTVQWYKDEVLNLIVDYNNSYSNGTAFSAILDSGNLTVGDFWKCGMKIHDGTNYSNWVNSSSLKILSAVNVAPVIDSVSINESYSPIEAGTANITFYFVVNDDNGASDINVSSARANFTRAGEALRENLSCVNVSNIDSYRINFSCTIEMWYFDSAGDWNITAYVEDNSAESAINDSVSFDYQKLLAFVLSPGAIAWSGLEKGDINATADNFTLLNNTGNVDVNISLKAINLLGERVSSYVLFAENFSVSNNSGILACAGNQLSNGSYANITGALLQRGNLSIGGGEAQEEIHYCIPEVPFDLIKQIYSTLLGGAWEIKITAALVFLAVRRRKRRELTRKKGELQRSLAQLKKKFKVSSAQLVSFISEIEKEEKKEKLSVPLSLFKDKLGPAESLVRYMKEKFGLRLSEIAKLLRRDDRSIWVTYRNACEKKEKVKVIVEKTEISVSISIFSDRRLSILESLVKYLHMKGMSNSEIASALGKDQRNIYTIAQRAEEKLAGQKDRQKVISLALAVGRKKRKELTRKECALLRSLAQLKKKFKVSSAHLISFISEIEKEEKKEKLSVPLSLFKDKLGPAESLVRYMKEKFGLRLSEIAKLLRRDDRSIWVTYRNACEKKEKIVIEKTEVNVSISIFSDRRLSILESLVTYLHKKGMSNAEIARALGKDQRNIYTIAQRAEEKLRQMEKNR